MRKPDQRIFEAPVRALDCDPADTLIVGGHPDDDCGGEALGIRTVILPMSAPGSDHGLRRAFFRWSVAPELDD